MALRYLDNALGTGANNGTSWANAWQSIGAMSGLAAGDTVYISAPDGGTQTYSFSDVFPTVNGSSGGGRITYQIGQDVGHRGTVIFNQTSVGFSNGALINGASYMNFIGDAGDGLKHFQLSGTLTSLLILQGTDTNVRMAYFDMGTFVGRVGSVNPGTHIELDHIDGIFPGYLNMDAALIFNVTGSTWDENLVHDCDWDIPWNSTK